MRDMGRNGMSGRHLVWRQLLYFDIDPVGWLTSAGKLREKLL